MNPTPRLRWVVREGIPILQQWFAYDINYPMTKGQWKDVPLEKETIK